jgi:AraC-like DNA-binding protein
MALGGTITSGQQTLEARLFLAYVGVTRFAVTRWKCCHHRWWVLDYLNQGHQEQRIGDRKAFTRLSSMAALYAPGRDYQEHQIKGDSIEESYAVFDVTGATKTLLRELVGPKGWCHVRDPDHIIGGVLRRMAELLFYRRPGFQLLAQGALLELLGFLVLSEPLAANLRDLRKEDRRGKTHELVDKTEHFITSHIAECLSVAELASQAHMSVSAFAHAYRRLANESPHAAAQRLKIEAVKQFLLRDGLSIKECAVRLGFSSEFHLSRLFKRLEGLSPSHYRQALMEKRLGRAPGNRKRS